MKRGLLLTNLGTPNNSDTAAVRMYLREFLTDKRVVDIPWLFRYILVHFLIVPFRAKKSAHAYQSIWTEHGSPLLYYSQNLVTELQKYVGKEFKIALGMRYGSPSIESALAQLNDCESITVLPLYPQYSSAATGSSIEKVLQLIAPREVIPSLNIIHNFYQHPLYIEAQAHVIKTHWDTQSHLLFSYHGIPERQIYKSGCNTVCSDSCPTISMQNQGCYKAQCYQTSRLLAEELKLNPQQYSTSFQSRLGKTPWIKPYTDEVLMELASRGIKNLTIVCPSFVTDCLETLEEIGMRAKEQWANLGGTQFSLIPCMNTDSRWIDAILDMTKTSDKP